MDGFLLLHLELFFLRMEKIIQKRKKKRLEEGRQKSSQDMSKNFHGKLKEGTYLCNIVII